MKKELLSVREELLTRVSKGKMFEIYKNYY